MTQAAGWSRRWGLVSAVAAAVLLAACSDREPAAPETPSPPPATATATRTAQPTPRPGTGATRTPAPRTATPVPRTVMPSPTARPGEGVLLEHGDRNKRRVALTFDMGGRVDPALDIMELLIEEHVPATLFMTGAMAENQNTEAGREVLRLAAAHPDLFLVGNHSYSHANFINLAAAEIADELARTEAAVARVFAASMRPWFRPPLGAWNDAVVRAAAAAGYGYTVMWDVDTIDWRPESDGGPTRTAIVDKVLSEAQNGSIVLMHLGGYNTLRALPEIIDGLRERGLEPVTLAGLVAP